MYIHNNSGYPSDWAKFTIIFEASIDLNLDRAVRVGYPPKHFKPHFWFSRPDCPLTHCRSLGNSL